MKFMTIVKSLTIICSIHNIAFADGQLMVMPVRTQVHEMQTSKLRLSNLGDKPLYLKLDLQRVDNPGEKPEIKSNIGDIKNPELMINATKITLGPSQKKDVVLIPLRKPTMETVYRLYIIPVSSIKIAEDKNDEKIEAPFTFGVGYGVIINHMPKEDLQSKSLEHQCLNGEIILTASGNTHNEIKIENYDNTGHSLKFNVYPRMKKTINSNYLKGTIDGNEFEISCK